MKLVNVINPAYLFNNKEKILPKLRSGIQNMVFPIHRFCRDRGVALTANDRKVIALEDKHVGKRCFILGNGPSLKIEDLNYLKNEVTFASNKIYLAFESTFWRPTYYSVVDVLVAENNRTEIDALNLTKIFELTISPFFKMEDAIWVQLLSVPMIDDVPKFDFSINALKGVYGGFTVVYFQLQLAFYMGIREIYLIGVDFSFDVPEKTGESSVSGEILKHQGEKNHFHPDYRKPGETWTMPMMDEQKAAFTVAKKAIESAGGKVYNASRETKLDVFERVDFDRLFE